MADSARPSIDSTITNDDKCIHVRNSETSSTNETMTITLSTNIQRNKRKLTSEQYHRLADKLLEIEQINCEESFVYEELNRLDSQRQYLQNLLNILHAMDSNPPTKKSRSR